MTITRRQLLASMIALAAMAGLAMSPHLLGSRVASAVSTLRGADQGWLFAATLGFVAAFGCTVCAWRAGLAAAGAPSSGRAAAAALGVGSMVNSFAPAKLGDAVKVALCARAIDAPGRMWTAGGVYAALAAARTLGLAALVVVASVVGALPWWPVLVLCGMVAALAAGAHFSQRLRSHRRGAQILDGFASLEHSPRAAAAVMGWTLGMVAARVVATAAV